MDYWLKKRVLLLKSHGSNVDNALLLERLAIDELLSEKTSILDPMFNVFRKFKKLVTKTGSTELLREAAKVCIEKTGGDLCTVMEQKGLLKCNSVTEADRLMAHLRRSIMEIFRNMLFLSDYVVHRIFQEESFEGSGCHKLIQEYHANDTTEERKEEIIEQLVHVMKSRAFHNSGSSEHVGYSDQRSYDHAEPHTINLHSDLSDRAIRVLLDMVLDISIQKGQNETPILELVQEGLIEPLKGVLEQLSHFGVCPKIN